MSDAGMGMLDPAAIPSAPRVLSSAQTWSTKFLLPVFWLAICFYVTVKGHLLQAISFTFPILPLAFALVTASMYWYYARLKKVTLSGSDLLISNYSREIRVPLRSVTSVKGSRMSKTHQITVKFDPSLGFDGSIIFMPKMRFLLPFQEHPLAQELRDLVDQARYRSAMPHFPRY